MYHTGSVAEFRQKLAESGGLSRAQGEEEPEEASPLVKRWLMLADQLLSTDAGKGEPA